MNRILGKEQIKLLKKLLKILKKLLQLNREDIIELIL
jgi:hypothetical protein